jgi:hypothetical protein
MCQVPVDPLQSKNRLLDARAVLASYLGEAEEAAIRNLICHEG